jgi:hypothetical protein
MSINRFYDGTAWNQEDTTRVAWTLALGGGTSGDNFSLARAAPGGALTTPMTIGSDGKTVCTLADTSVTTTMLAAGATVRNLSSGGAPPSSSIPGDGTWHVVATTSAITVRANTHVMLVAPILLQAVVGANTSIFLGFGMDSNTPTLYQTGVNLGAGTFIVPGLTFVSGPIAAGSHTFTYLAWCNTGALGLGGGPGYFYVIELA